MSAVNARKLFSALVLSTLLIQCFAAAGVKTDLKGHDAAAALDKKVSSGVNAELATKHGAVLNKNVSKPSGIVPSPHAAAGVKTDLKEQAAALAKNVSSAHEAFSGVKVGGPSTERDAAALNKNVSSSVKPSSVAPHDHAAAAAAMSTLHATAHQIGKHLSVVDNNKGEADYPAQLESTTSALPATTDGGNGEADYPAYKLSSPSAPGSPTTQEVSSSSSSTASSSTPKSSTTQEVSSSSSTASSSTPESSTSQEVVSTTTQNPKFSPAATLQPSMVDDGNKTTVAPAEKSTAKSTTTKDPGNGAAAVLSTISPMILVALLFV